MWKLDVLTNCRMRARLGARLHRWLESWLLRRLSCRLKEKKLAMMITVTKVSIYDGVEEAE